jgi:transposase-like protein
MRETRFKEGFECPHCTSEHVIRFGKYNGHQRYRCKCCSKIFTDTTNTVLYHTRKGDEWITFVDCMFKGYSLRKSVENVGVTWVTLFYLRYKLLSTLKQKDFEQFEGIVEGDENYFLYSEKVKRGITDRRPRKRGEESKHRDITTHKYVSLLPETSQKRLYQKSLVRGVLLKTKLMIVSKLSSDNVLVTDAWRAYKTYAKEKVLEH